jgi:hypothetical protein
MINILGQNYYIDLDVVEKYLEIEEVTEVSGDTESKVNLIKFELVKLLLETVLSEGDEEDERLGLKNSSKTSIPFKLAFNTLLNKKLINYY